MSRFLPVLAAASVLAVLAAAPALGGRLPARFSAVPGNPADRLADRPIEPPRYDPATRCSRKQRPGVEKLEAWLSKETRGASWGSYRCEKWGSGRASLHSEGRALDWHLDASRRADARAARRLIRLLLAPDRAGNPRALARRMGVQEIIWDCGYWGAAMDRFVDYRPCLNRRGELRRRVSPTLAHRDHIHLGLTRAGAAGRTSFWSYR